MTKEFNTTGSCNPERHYMVNIDDKLAKVKELVDKGLYFTINRARQFGKTTMMDLLYKNLKNVYKFIYISFESDSVETWQTTESFCSSLIDKFLGELPQSEDYDYWKNCKDTVKTLDDLSLAITKFCEKSEMPVVVMIDEVDKSQDNQIFLCFLGMLRNKYLKRTRENSHSTFYSVILAGVYDVKNLKLKIRTDEERKYNSPWNIAVRFNVDMTLSADGIKGMLDEYEADYHTGMDTKAIAAEIRRMTSGYPFLVSFICSLIHEEFCGNWSVEGVKKAIKWIVVNNCTLMDDLSKNLEIYPDLKKMLKDILLNDKEYLFEPDVPAIRLGNMFSFIRNDETGHVAIHNLIFEQKLYNYFMAEQQLRGETNLSTNRSVYISNGKLNMPLVIERFKDLLESENRSCDEEFLEKQGRLLFLCFLKPIINGTGFYYVEPQTRNDGRMDIVVTYGGEEFIIELKIWRGMKYETKGEDQVSEYANTRGLKKA
ncbi:MAG: AAA-like domain-containing protein, partial [Paludibacteraceae bacterium]|nr:AAA-like domain-containing protein [Paludibacteraceae bacterium]